MILTCQFRNVFQGIVLKLVDADVGQQRGHFHFNLIAFRGATPFVVGHSTCLLSQDINVITGIDQAADGLRAGCQRQGNQLIAFLEQGVDGAIDLVPVIREHIAVQVGIVTDIAGCILANDLVLRGDNGLVDAILTDSFRHQHIF